MPLAKIMEKRAFRSREHHSSRKKMNSRTFSLPSSFLQAGPPFLVDLIPVDIFDPITFINLSATAPENLERREIQKVESFGLGSPVVCFSASGPLCPARQRLICCSSNR